MVGNRGTTRRRHGRNFEFTASFKKYFVMSGLTIEEFAKRIGVSNTSVKKWYYGESDPRICYVPIIAEVLGITPNDLFGFTES